jgi:hypothetical protein
VPITEVDTTPRLEKGCMEFWVPLRLVSPLNVREHWSRRSRRAQRQREAVCAVLHQVLGERWSLEAPADRPKRVQFTAYVGRLLDDDNLVAALKSVRDGLQDAGVISGDSPREGHVFTYSQLDGQPIGTQGVRIRVTLGEIPPAAPAPHEDGAEACGT